MISLIVPTRNRARTLRLVASSYFEQDGVSEIVFVDDAGTDETGSLIANLGRRYPSVKVQHIRNSRRLGASQSRNIGVVMSSNEYILFCDDDEFLEAGYARKLLQKLIHLDAGAVSGRRIYMMPGETTEQALRRFGDGMHDSAPFHPLLCEYVNGARFSGDIEMPITNAIIMTRKNLLLEFPFDAYYARGNGYREETDFQMNLFTNGHSIYVTNDCHSLHLPLKMVRGGNHRTSALKRIYWSIHCTRYFFGKYYEGYAQRVGLRAPRWAAVLAFACFAIYRETLRPPLYAAAVRVKGNRRTAREQAQPA